jgi:hypothetical protein
MVVATRGENQPVGMEGQRSHVTPVRTDQRGNWGALEVEKAQHSALDPTARSLPLGLKASEWMAPWWAAKDTPVSVSVSSSIITTHPL